MPFAQIPMISFQILQFLPSATLFKTCTLKLRTRLPFTIIFNVAKKSNCFSACTVA